jgi:hypothetical protein
MGAMLDTGNFQSEIRDRGVRMIAQTKLAGETCPHCIGRTTCDCTHCGRRVRYIDFGGKWHRYYESGTCRKCRGKGILSADCSS